jgi:hypothetical protein
MRDEFEAAAASDDWAAAVRWSDAELIGDIHDLEKAVGTRYVSADPAEILIRREERAILALELVVGFDKLTPIERKVLELKSRDFDYTTIGQLCGITPDYARQVASRGRRKLAVYFSQIVAIFIVLLGLIVGLMGTGDNIHPTRLIPIIPRSLPGAVFNAKPELTHKCDTPWQRPARVPISEPADRTGYGPDGPLVANHVVIDQRVRVRVVSDVTWKAYEGNSWGYYLLNVEVTNTSKHEVYPTYYGQLLSANGTDGLASTPPSIGISPLDRRLAPGERRTIPLAFHFRVCRSSPTVDNPDIPYLAEVAVRWDYDSHDSFYGRYITTSAQRHVRLILPARTLPTLAVDTCSATSQFGHSTVDLLPVGTPFTLDPVPLRASGIRGDVTILAVLTNTSSTDAAVPNGWLTSAPWLSFSLHPAESVLIAIRLTCKSSERLSTNFLGGAGTYWIVSGSAKTAPRSRPDQFFASNFNTIVEVR